MGLTTDEYDRVLRLLGREPNLTELGMFAVMWSEHCGYKYSRPILAYFDKYKAAIEGDGLENAGVVDIGDGLGVVMKVESHNHPSAVEPFQGAATGVGGIIRDIFTMGAQPIAVLNSLRFGPIVDGDEDSETVARNRYLFSGVVAGIARYGNCVGVPTVGGEVSFHPRYSGNPLVNAMCLGIVDLDSVPTSAAAGPGNPVIYLGSATGKDGIHGATFASDALGDGGADKRPNVQIGDPFEEKLLIEATLEALATGAVVAIQDMGAAGLTCSTCEMSASGGVGMRVDLDLVPMREDDMSAYELMLSESQERMLCVAERGREHEVIDVFRKWEVNAVVIGEVTDDGVVRCTRHGELAVELPARLLTDECPSYTLPLEEPKQYRQAKEYSIEGVDVADPQEALLALLSSPAIASKRWVYEQYDQQVQTQTVRLPGSADAAVLAPRGTEKGLALTIDGNGRWVFADPYVGGQLAVVEAARNVACCGARPVAVTDGLNFGNPTLPHVYWQFEGAVRGIADACSALGTPVVSGNVSFYNESSLGEVLPTPLIGMLGVLDRASDSVGLGLPKEPADIGLLWYENGIGDQEGLGASEYLALVHGTEDGCPVAPNLAAEKDICVCLVSLAARGLLLAAHDVSEGGSAVALAEMSIAGLVGCTVDLAGEAYRFSTRADSALFAELPGFVFICFRPESCNEIDNLLPSGIRLQKVGRSGKSEPNLRISANGKRVIDFEPERLRSVYENALPDIMSG